MNLSFTQVTSFEPVVLQSQISDLIAVFGSVAFWSFLEPSFSGDDMMLVCNGQVPLCSAVTGLLVNTRNQQWGVLSAPMAEELNCFFALYQQFSSAPALPSPSWFLYHLTACTRGWCQTGGPGSEPQHFFFTITKIPTLWEQLENGFFLLARDWAPVHKPVSITCIIAFCVEELNRFAHIISNPVGWE